MKVISDMIELQRSQIIQPKIVVKREMEMAFNDCPENVIRFLNKWSDKKLTATNENHFEPAQTLLNLYKFLN